MPIKLKSDTPMAETLFTDREVPTEAFGKAHGYLCEHRDERASSIINFYGVGGIGKSSLLNEIIRRLEVPFECAKVDFANFESMGKMAILRSLATQLYGKKSRRFDFYAFRFALICYEEKTGIPMEKMDDRSSFLDGNPVAGLIVSVASATPFLGSIANAVSALDQGISTLHNAHEEKRLKSTLQGLENQQADEILAHLEDYFAADLNAAMEDGMDDGPITIFLDTYERFTDNMLNNEASIREGERWLLHIIERVGGVLWVVAGREKLDWPADFGVESHLIGELERKDSDEFLRKSGVAENLFEGVYDLTQGTPVFLDLCVEKYRDLKANSDDEGASIQVSDLGSDTRDLVERYVRYMNDDIRHLAYMLACLGRWTDALAEYVGKRSEYAQYRKPLYDKLMRHTFITKNDEERSYMHDVVREVLYSDMDPDFKGEINRISFDYNIEEYDRSENFDAVDFLQSAVRAFLQGLGLLSEDVIRRQFDKLKELIDGLYDDGRSWAQLDLAHMLLEALPEEPDDNFYIELQIEACDSVAQACRREGRREEAVEQTRSAYEKAQRLYGDDKRKILEQQRKLGCSYSEAGEHDKGIEMLEEVYEGYREIAGEDGFDTLTALEELSFAKGRAGDFRGALAIQEKIYATYERLKDEPEFNNIHLHDRAGEAIEGSLGYLYATNLATAYQEAGEYGKALEIQQELYEQQKAAGNGADMFALTVLNNMGDTYQEMGDPIKALEIQEKVQEGLTELLGEDDPHTFVHLKTLAVAYEGVEDYQSEMQALCKLFEHRQEAYGPTNINTLGALVDVQLGFILVKNSDAAIEAGNHALLLCEDYLGPRHDYTMTSLYRLAWAYSGAGDEDNAQACARELMRRQAERGEEAASEEELGGGEELTDDEQ